MARTLDDVGAGGGGGRFLNAEAKSEVYEAGAAFYIVDAEPFVEGSDGFDDQTVFEVMFEEGAKFEFMAEDAEDDATYKLAFRHTSTRKDKANKVLRALATDPEPIGPTYLITGPAKNPAHSAWWDITAEAPEEKPKATPAPAARGRRPAAARATRAPAATTEDDGI